jgi:hypothetical protein
VSTGDFPPFLSQPAELAELLRKELALAADS